MRSSYGVSQQRARYSSFARMFVAGVIVAASGAFISHAASAQEGDDIQQQYEALAKIGPAHEVFATMEGKWNADITSFMGPGGKTEKSTGTATFRRIFGGRYLIEEVNATFGGKAFEGMGTFGFDNSIQKYVTTWIDNMGTGIMRGEATLDETTETMTEHLEGNGPGGQTYKMKSIYHRESENHIRLTMYMLGPEQAETKVMEIIYKR
ncbi:MAG: DUF1579 domain-containing protein [Pirellulaceae bacterium]